VKKMLVTTLRIFDLDQHALAVDLRDLLDLLAPRSLQADWMVSPVKASNDELFDATGEGGERLDPLARARSTIPGRKLAALAKATPQVIWGEFVGSFRETENEAWVMIRAIDSTFYEVTTSDETVLNTINPPSEMFDPRKPTSVPSRAASPRSPSVQSTPPG
jgi:hypothetical protein